jgi:hypothetical protein
MDFIILALATWRLSNLLVNESGPYDVFERVRAKVGVYYDDYGNPQGANELARGLTCVYCVSTWIAAALTVLLYLLGTTVVWIFTPLAVSAAAVLVDGVLSSSDK